MSDKYDLSSIGAIAASAELARARANQEPSQDSYNAAWLHGYADALADAATQLEPQQQLFDAIIGYMGEHNDSAQLYAALHGDMGLSDGDIRFLGFDLPQCREDSAAGDTMVQAVGQTGRTDGAMGENAAPMSSEEFQGCITELLGEVDPVATKNWLLYADTLDESGTEPKGVFLDEICGELKVIRDSCSLNIARQLYDYGQRFTFAPFELRTAAEHLKSGKAIEEVSRLAVEGDFFTMSERYHKIKKEGSHER